MFRWEQQNEPIRTTRSHSQARENALVQVARGTGYESDTSLVNQSKIEKSKVSYIRHWLENLSNEAKKVKIMQNFYFVNLYPMTQ